MTNEAKLAAALAFLGTRYVLHKHYEGRVSHSPLKTDVKKTIRRVEKQQEAAKKKQDDAASRIFKLRSA